MVIMSVVTIWMAGDPLRPAPWTLGQPPQILVPPQNALAGSGGDASSVSPATGYGTLSYQWQFNGVALAGATNSVLNLSGVTPLQAGPTRSRSPTRSER